MIYGKDVSQYNNYIPGSEDFVMIKMSGGDAGLYFDSKATLNYTNAKNAGKVVGGYHFAGGTDPIAEADYFVRAMTPIEEYDVFALDWEIQHSDPVGWVQSFVNEVHAKTGVWCLVYLNISTTNAYNWTPVLQNCGLWLAAPSISYDANAPIQHTYVMQQGPIVDGIDQDVFFGTREELQAYGYHAPTVTVSEPTPVVSTPTVVQTTTSTSEPVTIPSTQATTLVAPISTVPEPVVTKINSPSQNQINTLKKSPHKQTTGFWSMLWNWFLRLVGIK